MLNKIKLTPHFTLAEMLATQTFNGKGVDYNCESLTPEIYNNLVRVANYLEDLRGDIEVRFNRAIPIYVNSGFRCTRVNSSVNGASKSDHLKGLAVDINTNKLPQIPALRAFIENYINDDVYDNRLRYYEIHDNYIHISFYPYA